MSLEKNAVDHLHDWHDDAVSLRERERARGRDDAFGDRLLALAARARASRPFRSRCRSRDCDSSRRCTSARDRPGRRVPRTSTLARRPRRRAASSRASPRVISAARELWPRPTPSTMPVATAMTFLSEPPSSTPMHVVVRVDAERRAAERELRHERGALIRRRRDDRRRLSRHDFRGEARPRDADDVVARATPRRRLPSSATACPARCPSWRRRESRRARETARTRSRCAADGATASRTRRATRRESPPPASSSRAARSRDRESGAGSAGSRAPC